MNNLDNPYLIALIVITGLISMPFFFKAIGEIILEKITEKKEPCSPLWDNPNDNDAPLGI